MKAFRVMIVLMAVIGLSRAAVYGQSLLQQGQGKAGPVQKAIGSPYDEPVGKTFKKHDLIQVVVVERSKGSSSANLRTDKRSRTEMSLDKWLKFKQSASGGIRLDAPGSDNIKPEINLDARYRQDNIGRTSRAFELTFTVAAEVVDVRPNGNLVIEAKKDQQVNSETQTIKLTGEVSPAFIADNSVRSENVANLSITYMGNGSVGDVEKPGLLGQLLGWLWIF